MACKLIKVRYKKKACIANIKIFNLDDLFIIPGFSKNLIFFYNFLCSFAFVNTELTVFDWKNLLANNIHTFHSLT